MTSEISIACEVDEAIFAWRARVLNILLWVYAVIMLVPLAAVLTGRGLVLPWFLQLLCLLLYLILLLATLRLRRHPLARAYILLGAAAVMGTLQLAVGQLP